MGLYFINFLCISRSWSTYLLSVCVYFSGSAGKCPNLAPEREWGPQDMRIIDITLHRPRKNTTQFIVYSLGHYIMLEASSPILRLLTSQVGRTKNRTKWNPTQLTCPGALTIMEASIVSISTRSLTWFHSFDTVQESVRRTAASRQAISKIKPHVTPRFQLELELELDRYLSLLYVYSTAVQTHIQLSGSVSNRVWGRICDYQ